MSGIVGQNTLDNSGLIKSPAGGGAWNFIKKLTASASADLSFVDGTDDVVLDSTYKEYVFTFNNMHSSDTSVKFHFQANAVGGSGYNETMTTTAFGAYHKEDGSNAGLGYVAAGDQAEGTSFQNLISNSSLTIGNDESLSGLLHLFNPSSTTFVKHFISTTQSVVGSGYSINDYTAGYFNTTSAIDEIQFKMSAGNIDAGDICLYGISS